MGTVILPGPTLAHGIPYLLAEAMPLVPTSVRLQDRVTLRTKTADGWSERDLSCRIQAAAPAVGEAPVGAVLVEGDPCPKHRALGVNDGCPDCDPAVLS